MRGVSTPSLPRRSAAATSAALAVLALAACGNDLEAFRDDLRPLEDTAEQERSETAARLRSVRLGSGGDARALRAHADQLSATYEEIAELDAPDDYEKPFRAYVRANERQVRDLRRFADELAAGDEGGLERASRAVTAALGESESARLRWLE